MTTVAQIRKAALALPESEEGTHFGMVSFSVRGKGFCSITKDGLAQLHLSEADVVAALGSVPGADRLTRRQTLVGARLPLAGLDGQQANHWVRRAWLHRAPKRLAAEARAAETARAGEVGDLPKAIGNPATRALVGAGITSLEGVVRLSERELHALHGVGPRAVRILSEALAASGRSLSG